MDGRRDRTSRGGRKRRAISRIDSRLERHQQRVPARDRGGALRRRCAARDDRRSARQVRAHAASPRGGGESNVHRTVDEVRLEAAKVMMLDARLSLTQVAYLVGFEEQSSFSRAFERWTGQNPREYRRCVEGWRRRLLDMGFPIAPTHWSSRGSQHGQPGRV